MTAKFARRAALAATAALPFAAGCAPTARAAAPTQGAGRPPFNRVKLGAFEVTNAQYTLFDPRHDSAYISMTNKDHEHRGHPANTTRQPVVRITWI